MRRSDKLGDAPFELADKLAVIRQPPAVENAAQTRHEGFAVADVGTADVDGRSEGRGSAEEREVVNGALWHRVRQPRARAAYPAYSPTRSMVHARFGRTTPPHRPNHWPRSSGVSRISNARMLSTLTSERLSSWLMFSVIEYCPAFNRSPGTTQEV